MGKKTKNFKKIIVTIIVIIIFIALIIIYLLNFNNNNKVNKALTATTNNKNITTTNTTNDNKTNTNTNVQTSISTNYSPNEKLTILKNTEIYPSPNSIATPKEEIYSGDKVVNISDGSNFDEVRYSTMNSSETGYIEKSDLTPSPIIPNNFNDLKVPSNVTKVQYGKSGEGRPLYYYQIGNGNKILLMTFEIHGYEDAWAQDGYELTKIAQYLINNLSTEESKNGNLNGWTVDIVPSANPDGLLDGYTNYGPGRAQISDKIDINRDFPGPGFVPTSTARNNTDGNIPLKAPEAVALANLTKSLMAKSKGNLAVVDTHGWLDMSSGDQGLANYFDNAFNLKNTVIHKEYYGGYFVGYAKMLGAKSVIVELPNPIYPANIAKENFDGKMLSAVNNLLKTYNFS